MFWETQSGFSGNVKGSKIVRSQAVDQKVFCGFENLEKAFDRFVQNKLWNILPDYGVDGRALQSVNSLV